MSTESLRRLGKYELQERLGHGGMAEVWKALDTQLQRHVAIKLLHANLQADPDFVARFQREAQAITQLGTPLYTSPEQALAIYLTEEFVSVYRMHPLLPDEFIFRSTADDQILLVIKPGWKNCGAFTTTTLNRLTS